LELVENIDRERHPMPGVGAPASGRVFGTGATAGRCAGGGDGDGAGKT